MFICYDFILFRERNDLVSKLYDAANTQNSFLLKLFLIRHFVFVFARPYRKHIHTFVLVIVAASCEHELLILCFALTHSDVIIIKWFREHR